MSVHSNVQRCRYVIPRAAKNEQDGVCDAEVEEASLPAPVVEVIVDRFPHGPPISHRHCSVHEHEAARDDRVPDDVTAVEALLDVRSEEVADEGEAGDGHDVPLGRGVGLRVDVDAPQVPDAAPVEDHHGVADEEAEEGVEHVQERLVFPIHRAILFYFTRS